MAQQPIVSSPSMEVQQHASCKQPLLSSPKLPGGSPRTEIQRQATSRELMNDLPDLTERIKKLGLMDEYLAFKDRYLAWRMGEHTGARGEMMVEHLERPAYAAANRGFGYWFPTVQDWLWSRTMAYWIAVTFFEGSIFFAISSFMYNHKAYLEDMYTPLTLYGYCAGKVCYFTCTYLMCLETINLRGHEDPANSPRTKRGANYEEEDKVPFYFNPFRFQTAFRNGAQSGAGPLPYLASITYFFGVLAFGVGVVAELGLPEELAEPCVLYSFLCGSILFFLGGFFECVQNRVFTTLGFGLNAWFGSLLNLLAGALFCSGAITGWYNGSLSQNLYGCGSLLYCLGSSVQIVMWKDEQFGLTFLSVLNVSDRAARAAMTKDEEHSATFSKLGLFFVHLWCFCGAMSVYNFNIEMLEHYRIKTWRSWQIAFNEFLPCVFSHMMLLLASAIMRTPKVTPFRQMHIAMRGLGVIVCANSTMTLYEFVSHQIQQ